VNAISGLIRLSQSRLGVDVFWGHDFIQKPESTFWDHALVRFAAATKDDETPGVPLVPESACKVRSRTSRSIPFVLL
jgi:hypothetical protein